MELIVQGSVAEKPRLLLIPLSVLVPRYVMLGEW
jgi:hypothetical protein